MGHCKFHVTPGHQQTLPRAMEAFLKDCGGREGGQETLECGRDVTSGEANVTLVWVPASSPSSHRALVYPMSC